MTTRLPHKNYCRIYLNSGEAKETASGCATVAQIKGCYS